MSVLQSKTNSKSFLSVCGMWNSPLLWRHHTDNIASLITFLLSYNLCGWFLQIKFFFIHFWLREYFKGLLLLFFLGHIFISRWFCRCTDLQPQDFRGSSRLPCYQKTKLNMNRPNIHFCDHLICSCILLSPWWVFFKQGMWRGNNDFCCHWRHRDIPLVTPFMLSPGLSSSLAVT